MTKCEICKYQENCPDIVEFDSVWCIAHRKLPKNFGNKYIEKQQLISFLEDKIKEYEKLKKYLYEKENTKLVRKATISGCIGAFQEVLDFVNKGGKE